MEFLCFQLSGRVFAIDIMGIREILRKFSIVELPQAPPEIAGVFNLRGELIPIFDPSLILLKKPYSEVTVDSNLIVVKAKSGNAGLLVDRVIEVTSVPLDSLTPIPGSDLTETKLAVAVFQAELEGMGLTVATLLRIGTLVAPEASICMESMA